MSQGFPHELLTRPNKEREDYFEYYTMGHPFLKKARDELRDALRQSNSETLVLVFGPTGVGKTTLRRITEKIIIEEALPTLLEDPGRIPIVSMDVVSPDSGKFSWRDFYIRALTVMKEPLIDKKILISPVSAKGKKDAPELRRSLENALYYRRPAAFILDDAQHFGKTAGGRRLQDQLDVIKSIAKISHVVHVLIGTYELLPFRNLNDQLSRNGMDVHFSRYLTLPRFYGHVERVIK